MAEFVMPTLGADMEAGTLVAWCKQPGEAIARGEVIAEIDTDKGVIEVECFLSGLIEKHLVEVGTKVPVGTPLAVIRVEGEVAVPTVASAVAAPTPTIAVPVPAVPVPIAKAETKTARLKVSPLARKLAEELKLDLTTITGTGPGGRITREDVERAAQTGKETKAVPPAPDRAARMRQTIAAAMTRAKREIPHYYLATTIDLHRALEWLRTENEKRAVAERLLYGVLLIKAVAHALREVPELNSMWQDERAVPQDAINIGTAISLRQGGLIAPALLNADQQSLDDLMKNFRDLVQRARAGGLRASELSNATITITSLGEQGVETVFGIIYPPQTALVGFGKIVVRPWVVDGQIVARPLITASLSADHRVSDGHRGGLFLAAIERWLQTPEQL